MFKMGLRVVFTLFLCLALAKATFQPLISVREFTPQDKFIRLTGGTPAEQGQFPHQVHIRSRGYCGGSIIAPSWILTAASCIFQANGGAIYIGSVFIEPRYLYIETNDGRTHPNFNLITRNHDIGLLNLYHSLYYNDRIRPIALPRLSQTYENFASGRTATVFGWGIIDNSGLSNRLQYGSVVVNPNSVCEAYYNSEIVINSTLCSSRIPSEAITLCYGDLGHAMTVFDFTDNIEIQIGITSYYGEGMTCSTELPLFTRPQFYWDWINANTGVPIRP